MAIDIHIDTTARQDTKLAKYLSLVNAERVRSGLTPYANISDLLEEFIIDNARSMVQRPDIEDAEKVRDAYLNATDNVQNQVKTLLGIT